MSTYLIMLWIMFIVHLMSLMPSHHLCVHRQSSFFCLGVVHNSVQIVPEHLHQMDGWCCCKRNCRPARLHQYVTNSANRSVNWLAFIFSKNKVRRKWCLQIKRNHLIRGIWKQCMSLGVNLQFLKCACTRFAYEVYWNIFLHCVFAIVVNV